MLLIGLRPNTRGPIQELSGVQSSLLLMSETKAFLGDECVSNSQEYDSPSYLDRFDTPNHCLIHSFDHRFPQSLDPPLRDGSLKGRPKDVEGWIRNPKTEGVGRDKSSTALTSRSEPLTFVALVPLLLVAKEPLVPIPRGRKDRTIDGEAACGGCCGDCGTWSFAAAVAAAAAAAASSSSAYTWLPKASRNKWHQLGPHAHPSVLDSQEVQTSPQEGQYR